jgi:hypothetical protein
MFYADRFLPKLVARHSAIITAAAIMETPAAFPVLIQPEHDQASPPAASQPPSAIHAALLEQTPTLKPGKEVSRRKSGRVGVLREVLQLQRCRFSQQLVWANPSSSPMNLPRKALSWTSNCAALSILAALYPFMIQGLCFLITPLGYIFMGAVLFNGNVESHGAAYLSELLPNV